MTARSLLCLHALACMALAVTACTEPKLPDPVAYGCSADQQRMWGCSATPVRVAGGHRFTELSAGEDHTCGLTGGGETYCWGASASGAVGASSHARVPARVNSPASFVSISAGGSHTCALDVVGQAFCWGAGAATGLTSFPDTCAGSQPCVLTPTPVAGALRFQRLRAGDTHTCGIATEGNTYCWGWNTLGEVGYREITTSRAEPQLIGGGHAFREIDARFRFNCALTAAGELYCWGWGEEGQLGTTELPPCDLSIMSFLCSHVPVPAATDTRFSAVSLGSAFGCGLDNGTIHCWGENGQYQLGRATPGREVAPIFSPGMTWSSIGAGYFHACAIRTDRSLYCWGSNVNGELGTGSAEHSAWAPAPVTGGLLFAQVVAGRDHTCGRTPDGTAWCWGSDRFGQLGRGP